MNTEIALEIGKRIRSFRKSKKLSISELASIISKSKATVSKYERGEIIVDIVTLYDIAKALDIQVDLLLYHPPKSLEHHGDLSNPVFFRNTSKLYSYIYDGRINKLLRCVFELVSKADGTNSKVMLYMNIDSYENYQSCENTYIGQIEHFDVISNIILKNQETPVEQITISVMSSFLDSPTKWGLMFGISTRPVMPIAAKMLISKKPLKEDVDLYNQLLISKDDIRIMKIYNMFTI